MVEIKPSTRVTGERRATIQLPPEEVRRLIGFDSNVDEDDAKYGASWSFTADGVLCNVWYRRYAQYPGASGPRETLEKVFGKQYVQWHG